MKRLRQTPDYHGAIALLSEAIAVIVGAIVLAVGAALVVCAILLAIFCVTAIVLWVIANPIAGAIAGIAGLLLLGGLAAIWSRL